ncbi:hypothetical protein OAP18_02090 [Gammaproteobacteria bacterium]|nr:hypothetical protein [Gammaproteobacteria bacterium]
MNQVVTKLVLSLNIFIVLFLSGCGALPQNIPLNEVDKIAIQTADILVTRQLTPGFMFTTPNKALVDAGVAEWADPSKPFTWTLITETHQVPDFTNAVKEAFLSEIADTPNFQRFQISESVEPWDDSADFSRLAAKYEAEYVLEFKTRIGMFGYNPLSWQTYRMNYFGDMILVRLEDQMPIWKVSCDVRAGDDNPLILPGEDFLKGDGELFRAAAAYATSTCAKQLASEFNANQ